jgi:nucleoside-diphosphate-sugar epimerase
MKIIVTGGCGLIGKYLVKELAKDHEVLVLDIRTEKLPKNVRLSIVDITDYHKLLEAMEEADVIYHLVGTVLNTARKNPFLAISLDVTTTANILEACLKYDINKIAYASSFYVYDGLPSEMTVTEDDHTDILNSEIFGMVKLVSERLILEYCKKYGLNFVILRYGPAYGPDDRCTCVVYDFIRDGLKGKPLVIWGKGERKNQYTYVEDLARGSILALNTTNEIFNLISPEQLTIKQVAELMAEKYGFKVEYDLNKPEGPSLPFISPKKAIKKLGWKTTPIIEGISKTATFLKQKLS